jgi:hypothetical protein
MHYLDKPARLSLGKAPLNLLYGDAGSISLPSGVICPDLSDLATVANTADAAPITTGHTHTSLAAGKFTAGHPTNSSVLIPSLTEEGYASPRSHELPFFSHV